jgi:hypothetical protein
MAPCFFDGGYPGDQKRIWEASKIRQDWLANNASSILIIFHSLLKRETEREEHSIIDIQNIP